MHVMRIMAMCALALVLGMAGCSFRMGDFQIVSDKNVALNPERIKRGVEGKACIYHLLGLIPLTGFVPNVEEAMDRAMEQTPEGNILTDVVVYEDFLYAVLFSQTCVRVKGDVGRLE
jgi:hypothetical protein